jgi:O-antigen/teichoic acid export membrane protein
MPPRTSSRPTLRRRLLRGIAWTAAVRLPAQALVFLANVLLARVMTPAELGSYSLLFSAAALVWTLGMLGMQGAVVKLMAEAVASGAPGRAAAVAWRALAMTAAASAVFAVVYAVATVAATQGRVPAAAVLLAATTSVPIALYVVAAEAFRGLQAYAAASVLGVTLYVGLMVAGLGALYALDGQASLTHAVAVCFFSALGSCAISCGLLWRRLRGMGARPHVAGRDLLRVGLPLMVGYLAVVVAGQADLWILGLKRPVEEVAAYAAAIRLVQHLLLPLLIMSAVIAPIVAELQMGGRHAALQRVVTRAARIDLAVASAAFALLLAARGEILAALFGAHYRLGSTAALLLGTGLLGQALLGPGLTVLAMARGQRAVMAVCIAAAAVQIGGGLAVVGPFGMNGVAAVSAASVVLQALLAALLVRRQTGIWTMPVAVQARRTAFRSVESA